MNTTLAEAFRKAGIDGARSPKRGRHIPRNNDSEIYVNAKSAVTKGVIEGVDLLISSTKDFDQLLTAALAAKTEGALTKRYAEMADKLGYLSQWNAVIWAEKIGDRDVVGRHITTPATRHMLGLSELPEHKNIEASRSLRSTLRDLLV